MSLLNIIHLIFWCGTLAGWLAFVVYGCAWFERRLDRFLDRWFYREDEDEEGIVTGGNVKRNICWIDYMNK